MLFQALLFGLFATLTAAQSGVLAFTRVPNPVTDGQPNVLLWQTNNTVAPCTIILQKGPSTQLTTVKTITTTATGGQYIWTPPVSLADGTDYVLLIKQGSQNNTFGPFTIQGANPSAVASASASSSSSVVTITRTSGGTNSLGTGTAMHRNTTMSHPTLTKHTGTSLTNKHTGTGKTPTAHSPTSPTTPVSSSSSAAAVSDLQVSTSGSSLALVLGAVAAIFYLH